MNFSVVHSEPRAILRKTETERGDDGYHTRWREIVVVKENGHTHTHTLLI